MSRRDAGDDLRRAVEEAGRRGAKILKVDLAALAGAVPATAPAGGLAAGPKPRYAKPGADGMNGLERRYAAHLEALRLAGAIHRWDFQPEKFRLGNIGDACYFTPDFRILLNDGTVEFVDVKGGHMMEDALVKIKWFAREHPYPLVVVRWVKGQWAEERWEN